MNTICKLSGHKHMKITPESIDFSCYCLRCGKPMDEFEQESVKCKK